MEQNLLQIIINKISKKIIVIEGSFGNSETQDIRQSQNSMKIQETLLILFLQEIQKTQKAQIILLIYNNLNSDYLSQYKILEKILCLIFENMINISVL